jgi:hypothetical protein
MITFEKKDILYISEMLKELYDLKKDTDFVHAKAAFDYAMNLDMIEIHMDFGDKFHFDFGKGTMGFYDSSDETLKMTYEFKEW